MEKKGEQVKRPQPTNHVCCPTCKTVSFMGRRKKKEKRKKPHLVRHVCSWTCETVPYLPCLLSDSVDSCEGINKEEKKEKS